MPTKQTSSFFSAREAATIMVSERVACFVFMPRPLSRQSAPKDFTPIEAHIAASMRRNVRGHARFHPSDAMKPLWRG